METTLYTIHQRRSGDRVRVVGDGRHLLAVVPPVWALWRGLYLTLAAMIAALVTMAIMAPAALGTLYFGILLLIYLEGSSVERAELRLRGWVEVGLTEARSEEGAEEDWTTGAAVMTR